MTLFASLKATPGVILIYGVLGLAGFLGPPLVGLLALPSYKNNYNRRSINSLCKLQYCW